MMVSIYLLLIICMVSYAYENIAFTKTAWQLHPFSNTTYSASNAVDGRKSNLHVTGNQCVISNYDQQIATWRVDLQDILSIRHITIYYRTDNVTWGPQNAYSGRFLGFSLYVSNTTDRTQGHLCVPDTNYTRYTIPAVVNVTCRVHGRYVIYYNERLPGKAYPAGYSTYAFNELCEVEVYGCPRPGFYGVDCSLPCPVNCRTVYCHIETGACQGCKPGYKGHQCEQENIALHKPAWQRSQFKPGDVRFNASNAVDGLKSDLSAWGGQCVISNINQHTATWRVNLEDILSIRHITIYYRTDNTAWGSANAYSTRFLGLSLYVSNTTDRNQGTLCFHDTNYTTATIPAVLDISCPVHGQYVIYYNERLQGVSYPDAYSIYAFNELCEVEVYGCPSSGFYGEDCSLRCPVNCRTVYCHIETGACQGCKPGYKGHRCQLECENGKYGEECQEYCGHCTDLAQCDHVNGTCLSGCNPGFKQGTCKDACDGNEYGEGCQQSCGSCLNSEQCHHVNGSCLNGCNPGYQGETCKEKCEVSLYGDNCSKSCGHCLRPEQCDNINGTCKNGCKSGFQGTFCNETCMMGTFGEHCRELCNVNCKGCDTITGICDSGCYTGWKGSHCSEECDSGRFGAACGLKCGNCLDGIQCDHVNGSCFSGCNEGFRGPLCKKVDNQVQEEETGNNWETIVLRSPWCLLCYTCSSWCTSFCSLHNLETTQKHH